MSRLPTSTLGAELTLSISRRNLQRRQEYAGELLGATAGYLTESEVSHVDGQVVPQYLRVSLFLSSSSLLGSSTCFPLLIRAFHRSIKPFDRHDWIVHRPVSTASDGSYTAASSSQKYSEHRCEHFSPLLLTSRPLLTSLLPLLRNFPLRSSSFFSRSLNPTLLLHFPTDVIDYYSLPDDSQGNPVFSLDVRPAVDSIGAVQERIGEWAKVKRETWFGEGGEGAVPGVKVQEK